MEKQLRVGTDKLMNKSQLNARDESNLRFGAHHKFVYLPDSNLWQHVNGTWTGALGHLINDNRMNWKLCVLNDN